MGRYGFKGGAALLAATALAVLAGPAAANVALTQVSADPFTNSTSQHATEVEPDTFASGGTLVSAFQVGRFYNGGSTDIGFARLGSKGWSGGFLPGMTFSAGVAASPYERVSDPSVAYDAKHGVWLISSIPLTSSTLVPYIFVSRSTDDGKTWSGPITLPQPISHTVDLDKNWTVCDNTASSPHYGNCYTEFDNYGDGDKELMSTSTDGGQTWSTPAETAGHDKGLGGQPLVQPNGNVIVPFESLNGHENSFESTDGGATWAKAVDIAQIRLHNVAGDLRTDALPTAEIDGGGRVYVAWEDCRFEKGCSANDIVLSSSSDGVHWSTPAQIPIDARGSGVDHFIPGLAVDSGTSGAGAHLALTYYYYPDATCAGGCQMDVGYISSPDGGAHWGAPTTLAGPMSLSDIAQTSQGAMVGDYISTSFVGGSALSVFAVGNPHTGAYDEAMYAPRTALPVATAASATRAASSAGVVGNATTGQGTGTALQALRRN